MLMEQKRIVAIVVVLAAVLAACGSSAKSGAGTTTSTASGPTTPVAACSAGVSVCGASGAPTVAVGASAPALAGAALNGSGHVNLDTLAGMPTVVVLWSPPCPHCQEAMPKIDALAHRLATHARFMSAAIERPDIPAEPGYQTAAQAVATMHLSMPTVAISRQTADATWHAQALPTAYLLDRNHEVVQVIQGADAVAIATALSAKFGIR
jgi:thiol-disulfide isomerase/thioredoxin